MRVLLLILAITITASAQFPNFSFEKWTAGSPDSCWTNNSVVLPVTQTSPGNSGASALKGEVISYLTIPYAPQLIIGTVQGFNCTSRPANMQFYYQFSPQGGDRLELSVTLRKNNPIKIIAAGSQVKITAAASVFTKYVVPLEYFYSETPDICVAQFLISNASDEHIGSYFLLDDLSFTGTVGVGTEGASTPIVFELDQNYPNPFNPSTTINYSIPVKSKVSLKIFDLLGRESATLVNEEMVPGKYSVRWNAEQQTSGVYFYVLESGKFKQTRKLLLLQ